ncbi:MAG TPA: tyrosine-type recombinase/integrase [Candidatus Nanoarchaeia archaeon]|nr:tyrosine-type recombinase/integrase [Candidatus Nanoarchaeia archaeon]
MNKRARYQQGSVVFDKRNRTWHFLWRENGSRRSKLLGDDKKFPTKAAAMKAAERLRREVVAKNDPPNSTITGVTVKDLVQSYRMEKMPNRKDTRRSYDVWLRCHIVPKFGECPITDVQARPVELWLNELELAPKSKVHIRGALRLLWDFAMWGGHVGVQRNPMELVSIKGASKRTKKPRSLTIEEFREFLRHLDQPFRTMAIVQALLGLRISEVLGLRWVDVDWLGSTLCIERAVVCQTVDEVKTAGSGRPLPLAPELVEELKCLHSSTQFSLATDWMFASPHQVGKLPWSYDQVWRVYQKAAKAAGIGRLGTHTMRHSYRTWLGSAGTPIEVQQKLMRHTDIRTTMNIYGDVLTSQMELAHKKVVGLALNGLQSGLQ